MPRDRHVRRSGDDYAVQLAALLPQGIAWSREPDSVLMKVIRGLAQIFGFVDSRAADLLERESDPRITLELLPDWERNWGLPDPCLSEPLSIADRQKALVTKMTWLGGQSRQFFYDLAHEIGYDIGVIHEFSPWTFGISECGLTDDGLGRPRWEIGPPEIRFYWTVHVGSVRLTWWRFGAAEFGTDPHCRIAAPTDIQCLFDRYKPAQTQIVYDFTEAGVPPGPT
jgi:uncharacterized protein YmfQ (DUF2313 family)